MVVLALLGEAPVGKASEMPAQSTEEGKYEHAIGVTTTQNADDRLTDVSLSLFHSLPLISLSYGTCIHV
ncbi:hypothetical protein Q7C36_021450 [Tachysurus vachellii]|uniref:Uncharacterized protein n=1 Tax=Tachysurus vachellii TaxID=175792 RepID=A0AA88ISQ5_TACVA|nr:hypothetical protein Q7C36_021450 [Tachysurus vachellii]